MKENERKALGAIGRLRACQLVVCPISDYHRQESIRDSRHREFKRAYAAFSGGAEWATTGEIEARQAYRHASGWIRQQAVEWTFPLEEALHETGDGWEADYSIILDMGDHAQRRAEADRVATSTTRDLQSLTEQWRRGATSFEAVFRAEAQQACWTHIKLAGEADARYREAVARGQPDAWMLHPGETRSGLWLNEVWRAFQEAGIPSDKLIETTARYAREADFTTLPYQRIADLTPAN